MAKYDRLMAALPEGHDRHRSCRRVVFTAHLPRRRSAIYVMRASNSGALRRAARNRRRPRLRRDRLQRVAGARIRLRVERRRVAQALRGYSEIPAAADSQVRVLSDHLSSAGDAVPALGGLCGHRQKLHGVARRQLRHHGRRGHDCGRHLRAVRGHTCGGHDGGHSSAKPRADALFGNVHDRAARHADAGAARVDVGEKRAATDGRPERAICVRRRDGRAARSAHDLHSARRRCC